MQELELTPEEAAAAEKLVVKLQRQADQWQRVRWLILLVGLLILGLGGYSLHSFWSGIGRDAAVSRQVAEGPLPSPDLPVQLWLNAEMNRQRELLRLQREMDRLAMLEGVIGVVLASGGIVIVVMLLLHWNDGPTKALLAKFARIQLANSRRQVR